MTSKPLRVARAVLSDGSRGSVGSQLECAVIRLKDIVQIFRRPMLDIFDSSSSSCKRRIAWDKKRVCRL